ncbi:MAG: penicillin acylase family protein [Myxococcaceae bacterium]|nr:penicillin acylase family protein [Myxococcaceae bacterium]
MLRSALLLVAAGLSSGCALTALVGYRIAPNAPRDAREESLQLEGLREPVQVTFDAQGVPHVQAKNLLDLARATGFVQGRARFFQMDMMRRLARGRVSEVVGEQPLVSSTTLEYDKTMRGWDIERRATADFGKLSAEQKALLEAFAEGVNAARARWEPVEYRLLRLQAEPWNATDTLAVGLLNVWSVTHNYQQEAARFLFAMHLGVERMEKLYPNEPVRGGRSIAATTPPQALPPAVAEELASLFPVKLPAAPSSPPSSWLTVLPVEGASNAWVVSGARTKSGKPMVANDPHLAHFLPGILVQQHLSAPGLDVIGVTVPGVPWVLSGHNAKVAWGMTSTMSDVIDLVVEQEDPSRPGFVKHEGSDCALTTRDEVVRVRDGDELMERPVRFRATCNGPLMNDLLPHLFPPGAPLLAIRWRVTGLESAMEALLTMDQATSVEAFGAAVARLPSTWNTWTVADVEGHIGLFPSGQVPARPNHRGTFPVPGWTSRYDWTEFAAGDRLPHAVDPPDGVLAHANNLMTEPGASDFARLQVDSAPAFRHQRIVDLAKATPKHELASFRAMLADTHSLRAQTVWPFMRQALGTGEGWTGAARTAAARLSAWDFDAKGDQPEAAIFFLTYHHAVVTAVSDELPAPAVKFFLGQRYSTNTADLWFEDAQHVVWDDRTTSRVETRDEVVRAAFARAVNELAEQQGAEAAGWRWGRLHWHRPMHAFGGKAVLDGLVNLERLEAGGEMDSVWKTHFDFGNEKAPFKVVAGPVYRSVVDLADVAHGWWVIDTGASGWPGSAHYGDQYEAWRRGELVPMLFDVAEVRRGVHGELTLKP